MSSSSKLLVLACEGKTTPRIPFWFMRQAGRYLPEYRELRAKQRDFLAFCYSPDIACEATLQPIRRFGMDGAIIFSDILVVPHALGMDVRFEEGVGPLLSPISGEKHLAGLSEEKIEERLAPVYEALRLTRKALPEETALIGFAGSPWTLSCYAVEGKSSKDFSRVKSIARSNPAFFSRWADMLTRAVAGHLCRQIEAGADVIQLFDSWAGVADGELYQDWVIAPTRRIVAAVKEKHPHVPIIGFPRQSGEKFEAYAKETGVDVVSIDQSAPLEWVKTHLQPRCIVQGALNNVLLAEDKAAMLAEAAQIVATLDKPFVFNLGHGILPATPIENVQALCEFLKKQT